MNRNADDAERYRTALSDILKTARRIFCLYVILLRWKERNIVLAFQGESSITNFRWMDRKKYGGEGKVRPEIY